MSLHTTPRGDRIHIALFGRRNAGKSSVINALTGQQLAIVSDVKGTTTDPVYKAMEILPLGPCMLVDTPGLDDEGELGASRIQRAMRVLDTTDIALVVADISLLSEEELNSGCGLGCKEAELISVMEEKKIPYIIILNQSDRMSAEKAEKIRRRIAGKNDAVPVHTISAMRGTGLEELKDILAARAPETNSQLHILGDLVEENDIVVLVTPVDSAAPKGRLIMPQQQTIRDLLDHHAVSVVTQVPGLAGILEKLGGQVRMVVTDSQVFKEVSEIVPEDIPLTSFSILFARHKGNLERLSENVMAVECLHDGDRILIAEGCTHRRQCDDIGTVKIPRWLREYTGRRLVIDTCSGTQFPEDLSPYALVIHCGGCTLHEKEMKKRMFCAGQQQVPIVNYGIFIAYVKGILKRSVALFPSVHKILESGGRYGINH